MGKSQDRRMDELKRWKKCIDCVSLGIEIDWPSECLDFDHRDPDKKVGSIRSMLHYPEALSRELAKCDVVCANHHRIRTRFRGVSERTKLAIKTARNKPGDRERDSEIQKRLWAERHETRAAAVREAQRRPEVRAKMANATADSWNDTEVRRKRSEGMKRAWETRKKNLLSNKSLS